MKTVKIGLWALNVLLAGASTWLLLPRPEVAVDLERLEEQPSPSAVRTPSWEVLASLPLPLGPQALPVTPETLPRVRGVLTGTERGSGVVFLEDPQARKEFAVLRGETVGSWTVASIGVDGVVLRGTAGERVLQVTSSAGPPAEGVAAPPRLKGLSPRQ